MKLLFILILILIFYLNIQAQTRFTEQQVVAAALKNSAAAKGAGLQVKQSFQLQKNAFNIANPDVIAESPTGEFYAIGVLQTIEFPTVYGKQYQLAKQQTLLSEKSRLVTENDIRLRAKNLYLTLQYNLALEAQYLLQDSLYSQIRLSAQRQFEAGQIDFLAKTFAEVQYGEIHNQYEQARIASQITNRQLQILLGIAEPLSITDFQKNQATYISFEQTADTTFYLRNALVQYFEQNKEVSKRFLSVEKNKALPGLVLGVLNQGARETPTNLRFRAGITLPIWFWQYKSRITAARTGIAIADLQTTAQKQVLSAEMQQAQGDFIQFRQSLEYYEKTGLGKADDIINTARRFFESGQNDYVSFLRNTNDAYAIKIRYLETLRNYNQAIININYLSNTP